MSLDLKNAIKSIQDKITISATTATAEELAYLGSAVDHIGGRATVYEVVEVGEIVKSEIMTLNTRLQNEINLDFTTEFNDMNARVQTILATMVASAETTETTTIDNIINTQTTSETSINTVKSNGIIAITDHTNDTIATAMNTLATAVTTSQDAVTFSAGQLVDAANALKSAASLAQIEALNSSLFTMLFLAGLK